MQRNGKWVMAAACLICLPVLYFLSMLRTTLDNEGSRMRNGSYESLPADASKDEPLAHMREDFTVDEAFTSNLPIVILSMEGEIAEYKSFKQGIETVDESVEPWTNGSIHIIDQGTNDNCLKDEPVYSSQMEIKKRGHTSFAYDKPQYLMKMVLEDGTENKADILGMGESDSWIINGSMADKSMIRNYLSYRIASEIGGDAMAPDSRFCEVLIYENGTYEYSGVYLLQETVSRGQSRVDIDQFKEKNAYTSYLIRRDRFTNFDVMLDTYGRHNGLSEEWIGVKYPSESKLTEQAKTFIEEDFSRVEQVLYSEDESEFKLYDKYIDVESFVDYFLINEYFGNYDAGEHSTYMYKNSGGALYIGPVWDFDQAMNNYFLEEMDPDTLAFQTKPFFAELTRDERFIDLLKKRYSVLRKGALSEEHVFAVIDEAADYLRSAKVREWYRWAADYQDGSFTNPHNYYLQDYVKDGVALSRFNDDYEQELYNIRTYLHRHGDKIQQELTKLYDLTVFHTSIKSENELLLLIIMVLFLVPSILINRKG